MKKLILNLGVLALVSSAFCDGIKFHGVITNADINTRSITLDSTPNVSLKILPNTEIDMEDCGLLGMWDKKGKWEDLKPGTFVKAEAYSNAQNNQVNVKEIEIKCGTKAY